jgi:RNA polymerase sigma factor (sigma-70 family)
VTIFRDNADFDLLRDFRQGKPSALEQVYWEYVDLVAYVVRRGTVSTPGTDFPGTWSIEHSDLVQETFARAFTEEARLAYDGIRRYQSYLLTICRNLLVDVARKKGRELLYDFSTDERISAAEPVSDLPEPWADPETTRVVRGYIAELPAELRTLYEARYVKGLSQVRTAQELKITRQRVRTLEKRLRKGLGRALKRAIRSQKQVGR